MQITIQLRDGELAVETEVEYGGRADADSFLRDARFMLEKLEQSIEEAKITSAPSVVAIPDRN